MNLLIFPQYPYPANHAVVNTVFETMLPARGHVVHMVRPVPGLTSVQRMPAPWGNGSIIGYPDEPVGGRLKNVLRTWRQSRWMARAMRELKDEPLDAMLVRNDLVAASAAAAESRRRDIPFVYQLSSPDAEFTITRGHERGGLSGAYMRVRGRVGLTSRRRVSRQAAAVLAISTSMRDHVVAEDGLAAERVFSFPMGVLDVTTSTPDQIEALRAHLGLPRDRTMVFSGVLDPVRQPAWMLDVFDLVRARVPGAVFLVLTYQTDDRRRVFEDDARRRKADVRVVGPVPFRDVSSYLRCADVAISSYRPMLEHKVASPTKTWEALCAGLPVVGNTEVDEHAEFLEASGGGIGVSWDPAQFADAIISLMEHPERRRQMGEQGRQWVLAHRSYSHLTEYLERILSASRDPAALVALPHEP